MTIAAVDTESFHMMLVTEWHRLLTRHSHPCCVGRPKDGVCEPAGSNNCQHGAYEADSRNRIGTRGKYLCHFREFPDNSGGYTRVSGNGKALSL